MPATLVGSLSLSRPLGILAKWRQPLRSTAHAVQPASARYWLVGAAYLAAYVALDWISFHYEFAPIGITPWNPPPGLSLVVLLREGLAFAPWLFVAAAVADVVVRGPLSWDYTLVSAAIIAAGYGLAAAWLRGRGRFDPRLERLHDVVALIAVSALAAAGVAALQGIASVAVGHLPPASLLPVAMRSWAGDLSGILVLSPLLLRSDGLTWTALRARVAAIDLESALQIVALGLALWIVFGLETTDEFKFFFLTLVPIVWIAVRHGLDGACLASLGAQLGLLLLVGYRGFGAQIVTEFQLLLLLVVATGLIIGAVATERAAADRATRRHEAELSHFSRISVAGEMVSALAHELSQPLAAAATYSAESRRLLRGKAGEEELAESMARAEAQIRRAGAVVARLRGFLYRGETVLKPTQAQAVVAEAAALVRAEAALNRVEISINVESTPARILADDVQMQQVIINIVRNAIEAVAESDARDRRIDIVQRVTGELVEIAVADTGPGLPPEIADRAFEPFVTTKAGGMGLGLAISRSIVQAHGGSLRFEKAAGKGATAVIAIPRLDHDAA
jgi:two-component system, LuxR family, sensor kinase FixL